MWTEEEVQQWLKEKQGLSAEIFQKLDGEGIAELKFSDYPPNNTAIYKQLQELKAARGCKIVDKFILFNFKNSDSEHLERATGH